MNKKQFYYSNHIGDLKQRLVSAIDREDLKELHAVRPMRHFLVLARLVLLYGLCVWALWQTRYPWLWIPAALLQGANILGFVVMLHEQVHDSIFRGKRPALQRLLGLLYALPSGISASQFKVWHLDHHNELGSDDDDPKRAHLSPKINKRWVKLLYMTPWLFAVYARAAMTEAKRYPDEIRKRIGRERMFNVAIHVSLVTALAVFAGGWTMFRVHLAPLFFCFPIAFTLNRLGQHYDIDPEDPAKWTTLVHGNGFWHFIFLWANFHIEHHYYPRVPFYNLTRLNRKLRPFYDEAGLQNRTYREIVWGWFFQNKRAHTRWD